MLIKGAQGGENITRYDQVLSVYVYKLVLICVRYGSVVIKQVYNHVSSNQDITRWVNSYRTSSFSCLIIEAETI